MSAAVMARVRAEIDAVGRAGLGDLTGRAVQAVVLDRLDVSPAQVIAAQRLLLQRVDAARDRVRHTNVAHREQTLAAQLDRRVVLCRSTRPW